MLRNDWQRGQKTEVRIQMAESGEGEESEGVEEVIKELGVQASTAMLADQLCKGYISIRLGCYLRCLTCKQIFFAKSRCTDQATLMNLIEKKILEVAARND